MLNTEFQVSLCCRLQLWSLVHQSQSWVVHRSDAGFDVPRLGDRYHVTSRKNVDNSTCFEWARICRRGSGNWARLVWGKMEHREEYFDAWNFDAESNIRNCDIARYRGDNSQWQIGVWWNHRIERRKPCSNETPVLRLNDLYATWCD